jgi:serine/threonine-protein kinase RsbW
MTPLQVLPGAPPPIGRCLFARSWPSRIDHKQEVLDTLVAELLGRGFITAEEEPWAVLVLDEVVVNAMLHGNEGDPTLSVVISLFTDDAGRWVLTVRDQGQGFDPASLPDPEDPASLLLEHGRGIRIMKEWLAELVYYERGACAWLARQRADRPTPTTPESP